MKKGLIAKESVIIKVSVTEVWDALINPEMIKKYLFGTQAVSDWKEGSMIFYRGVWEGKTYEDKGKIIKIVPEKILETTYWSSLSGLADIPENYKNVTYELKKKKDGIELTVSQDNNSTIEEKNHSAENWKMVLNKIKELLEEN